MGFKKKQKEKAALKVKHCKPSNLHHINPNYRLFQAGSLPLFRKCTTLDSHSESDENVLSSVRSGIL